MSKVQILQKKIDQIKEKNGIKTFECTEKDLGIFTIDELRELNKRGLISNYVLHFMLRKLFFKEHV